MIIEKDSSQPALINPHTENTSDCADLGSFAQQAREWACSVRSAEVTKEELFSFALATKLINFARETEESFVDVPLLPSIQIGARPTREQIDFGSSVLGEDCLPVIKKAFSKKEVKEFAVSLSQVKNERLLHIVSDISETLPEFLVSIVAKRNRYGFAEFFVRLNSNKVESEEKTSSETLPLKYSAVVERNNEKMVTEMRNLLQKRHRQFIDDPLSFEREALISPFESKFSIYVGEQAYCRHTINTFAIGVAAAAWIGQQFVAMFIINPGQLMIGACTVGAYCFVAFMASKNRLMHRLIVPVDPLNDLDSPSVQSFLSEVRNLGYRPRLIDCDGQLKLAVLFA